MGLDKTQLACQKAVLIGLINLTVVIQGILLGFQQPPAERMVADLNIQQV